ncbi:MAG: hypothetical protein R3E39_08415 [Anaerolineae bacterium]
MKSGSIGKDIGHILGIGIGGGLLLTIIGVLISFAIGVPGSGGGTVNIAALIPTPVPPTETPTPIPCTAQEWWDANGKVFMDGVNEPLDIPNVISTRKNLLAVPAVQKAQTGRADLKVKRTTFELAQTPPCAEAARAAALQTADDFDAYYNLLVTTSTEQDRLRQFMKALDSAEKVSDELDKLEVPINVSWVEAVKNFSSGECPAQRWFIEQIYLRDYYTYYTGGLQGFNPTRTTPADMETLLRTLRSLKSSLEADKASYPACVQPATDRLISFFDNFFNAVNSTLNKDLALAQQYLLTAPAEMTAFQTAVTELIPDFMR